MKLNVLISGPIRPSEDAVCEVIETIKQQLPTATIFLLTWTTNCPRVQEVVDHFFSVPEPNESDIARYVTARTKQQQQLQLADNVSCAKIPTYKMIYGVQKLCEYATPYISDEEKVIRIRTDSIFQFKADYLQELLSLDGNQYVTKNGSGFDWFAITTFRNLKRVWVFESLNEYNQFVNECWNPEDIIKRRIIRNTLPIILLENDRVDCYILRENGRKHYYD
jgi:hypothetical protein